MDNRGNMIAMMTLGAAIVALGGTIVSGEFFRGERPEKPGYVVEGVEEAPGGEAAAAAPIPIATLLPTADATKGAAVFTKCKSCHSIEQGGANGIGPNLWATLGEEIGKGKGGYAFSEALSGKGGKWDFEAMNAWLTSPKAYAPGTKMSFAGLAKPEDRANVIAYLNASGSNLPLPAAPAGGGAAPGGPTGDAAPAVPTGEPAATGATPPAAPAGK